MKQFIILLLITFLIPVTSHAALQDDDLLPKETLSTEIHNHYGEILCSFLCILLNDAGEIASEINHGYSGYPSHAKLFVFSKHTKIYPPTNDYVIPISSLPPLPETDKIRHYIYALHKIVI